MESIKARYRVYNLDCLDSKIDLAWQAFFLLYRLLRWNHELLLTRALLQRAGATELLGWVRLCDAHVLALHWLGVGHPICERLQMRLSAVNEILDRIVVLFVDRPMRHAFALNRHINYFLYWWNERLSSRVHPRRQIRSWCLPYDREDILLAARTWMVNNWGRTLYLSCCVDNRLLERTGRGLVCRANNHSRPTTN